MPVRVLDPYALQAMATVRTAVASTVDRLRRPLIADAIMVVALLGGSLLWSATMFWNPKLSMMLGDSWGVLVAAWWCSAGIGLGALFFRHRFPMTVCVVTACVAVYHMGWGWLPIPTDGAVLIAVYSAAVHARAAVSLAALAVVAGIAGGWTWYVADASVVKVLSPVQKRKDAVDGMPAPPPVDVWAFPPSGPIPPETWGGFTILGLVILPVWAAGQVSRVRRTYFERDQARQAELAVAAERARLSRELHDVVAHGLSVMVVQAQGGAAALDADREHTREALGAIVATGRQSLAEMRRLLGILREPAADGLLLAPQPGVAQLPGLVTRLRDTGLRVDLEVIGPTRPLPAAVDMSAYRIVQEALTNVIKHAGDHRRAVTRVSFEDSAVLVEVRDDGRGVTMSDGTGNGLRGMRERVAMLGGEFAAGPGSRGGFQVQAWLPAEPVS